MTRHMSDCCVSTVDMIVRWAREEATRLRGAMRDGRSAEGRHAMHLDHFADAVERGDWQAVDVDDANVPRVTDASETVPATTNDRPGEK